MEQVKLTKPSGMMRWMQIYGLYRQAFPASERKPFGIIVKMYRQGRADIWCAEQDGRFAGFATTVNGGDLILLDYFAVSEAKRGRGIGSAALAKLQQIYGDKGFFVEIETTRDGVPDRDGRLKRKHFYQTAGMAELHVEAEVFGVEMELLGSRCSLDFEGYRTFYRDHYSPWAAEHLTQPDDL